MCNFAWGDVFKGKFFWSGVSRKRVTKFFILQNMVKKLKHNNYIQLELTRHLACRPVLPSPWGRWGVPRQSWQWWTPHRCQSKSLSCNHTIKFIIDLTDSLDRCWLPCNLVWLRTTVSQQRFLPCHFEKNKAKKFAKQQASKSENH